MKTRQLIASTVFAISATLPAFALASGPTDHGDGTDHAALISQGKLATQATVLKEYQQAIRADQFNPLAGDSTVLAQRFESSKSRAEVLSAIKGIDLTEGDAS
ncbi:hypothetical protein [Limnobacter sp.]|uniref:hypothetical protein n=1 Tax=Limnobacter sp. TaxID=2003368 RepID=UPI002FDFE129